LNYLQKSDVKKFEKLASALKLRWSEK
jgi:hypothetical protein